LQQNLRLFSDRNLNKTLLLSETIRFMETKVFLRCRKMMVIIS